MRGLAWAIALGLLINGLGLLTKYRVDRGHTTVTLVDSRVRALEAEKATLQREAADRERAHIATSADLLVCQRTLTQMRD